MEGKSLLLLILQDKAKRGKDKRHGKEGEAMPMLLEVNDNDSDYWKLWHFTAL